MDDPNITMEEYIKIEEENARSRGLTFNWKTAKFGRMEHYYEEDRFMNFEEEFPAIIFEKINGESFDAEQRGIINEYDEGKEDYMTEFPAIVFNNTSDTTPPYEPTVSPPNEILENDDCNIALSPNPIIDHDLDYFNDFENEFPAIVYNDGLTSKSDLGIKTLVSDDSTDEFNFIDETSLSEYDEEIISPFNDLFNDIHSADSKSEIDHDDNNIGIIQSSEGNENALGEDGISKTSHDEIIETFETRSLVTNLNIIISYCVIGMLFFLIMNLYVPFGIPFDPKRYYKDGSHTKVAEAKGYEFKIFELGFDNCACPLLLMPELSFDSKMGIMGRMRDMAPLLAADQRHPCLRYKVEGYTPRLHIEQEMAEAGFGAYWDRSDRLIPDKGDLRDYWLQILSDRDFLVPTLSYVLIRDPVRRLCHRMIAYSISGRGQAPEKGKKSGERLSGGHFIGRLAMHFGLVTDEGLKGLQVAQGPERQQVAAAGASKAGQDAEERIERLEEEVHDLRRDVAGLRGDVTSFTTEQSRVSTWLISCMTQLMDAQDCPSGDVSGPGLERPDYIRPLVDLGASVSVMPFSTYTNLGLGDLSHTRMTIELADRTIKQPKGIAANVLVRIGKFVFPIDFVILDIPEDNDVPLILGRPFLSTAHVKIDVYKRKVTLRVGEEKLVFKSVKPASSIIKRVFMDE
ncbi:ty3-gypsy retrotransposon protein [Tanacetum coccineum]